MYDGMTMGVLFEIAYLSIVLTQGVFVELKCQSLNALTAM